MSEENLDPEEKELLEELRKIRNGLAPFNASREGLEDLADILTDDMHDLDVIQDDIHRLIQDIKRKGGLGEEELQEVRQLEKDDAGFHEDLRNTKLLLNKSQKVSSAISFIENLDQVDEAAESIERLSQKLEKIESQ